MSGPFKSCQGCPDRYPGCHGKCEKYLAEKAEWEQMKARVNADRASTDYIYDAYTRRQSERALKKKRLSQYRRRRWE